MIGKFLIIIAAIFSLITIPGLALGFIGINYGPFHKSGQFPGTPIPDSQFITDLSIISKNFNIIKTYGVDAGSNLNRIAGVAATNFPNLKIYQGVWEDTIYNSSGNTTFLDTAISLANTYPNIAGIVVGNECLPGDAATNPISAKQLITDLQYVKSRLSNNNILVTTSLSYGAASQNKDPDTGKIFGVLLAPYCDVIMVNIYPFYGGVAIDQKEAINNLINAYQNIFLPMYSPKAVIIGETGWPSAPVGSPFGKAVPSVANESLYTQQIFANANRLGSTFIYEAFDEPWGPGGNVWGPHWGLWDKDGLAKFSLPSPKRSLEYLQLLME
jgi:exo-beta-1,3-glucanase (GH17 family)